MFIHPVHHSTYPDQSFTFLIDGHLLNVWETAGGRETHKIEIFVKKESEHFSDEFLLGIAKEAFSALQAADDFSTPIFVKGRTILPKPPRDPAKVIAGINKYMELAFPDTEELAKTLFVPALVRPEELDAFLAYVSETGLGEISPAAQSLFREVIEQLISERK
ncbi:MAG: hypothetical protein ACOY3X_03155 [Pseudomonadota bacterium]